MLNYGGVGGGTYGGAGSVIAGIASLTGGTITGTNVPYSLLKTSIPFIYTSSGTMGNNGALSAITALPATYSDGCYLYLPAGAIAAGVPAASAWYYAVMSSTTAGTVFNNVYTTGTPTIPASPTAFATTGAGAFTSGTAEANGVIATVPAGALGSTGVLKSVAFWQYTSTAGNKQLVQRFGGGAGAGSIILNATRTTESRSRTMSELYNLTAAIQRGAAVEMPAGVVPAIPAVVRMTVNTVPSADFYTNMVKAAATDNVVLEYVDVTLQM